jgi:uncharacterized protein
VPLPARLQGDAVTHAFYLHGFASSPQSSKAAFFRTRLAEHHVPVHIPDFNLPDFSTLTISRMVDQVGQALDEVRRDSRIVLIGSSLGAFVAVQVAVRYRPRIDRLVLLAPALDFSGNRLRTLGDRGVDDWRRTNELQVFHYGFGRLMPVSFDLYTDAEQYDAFNAQLDQPILIFQGERDEAVDPATVKRWAESRPNVQLRLLDDDHQLLASLETIWTETAGFLELTPARSLPRDAARQA